MANRKRKPTKLKGKRHASRRKTAKAAVKLPQVQAAAPVIGAPTKFDPAYIPQARKLAALGAIDREIAEFFSVNETTFHRWKLAHPALAESLIVGKDIADNRVERALYNRAVGYSYDSEELDVDRFGDEHRMPCVKHVPPDTTAQIFWLKNRKPDDWRDRKEMDAGPGLARIIETWTTTVNQVNFLNPNGTSPAQILFPAA